MTLPVYWREYVSETLSTELPQNWVLQTIIWTTRSDFRVASAVFGFVISIALLYHLIERLFNKPFFKRFGAGNSAGRLDIEIFEESKDSFFDKYLNEVLYLFNNSNVDAVIFEDIDRYNVTRIFERLREVNTLVNSQRLEIADRNLRWRIANRFWLICDAVKVAIAWALHRSANWFWSKISDFRLVKFMSRTLFNPIAKAIVRLRETGETNKAYKPLRFFYLLKDDIFVSKERTKFFDFIIPIVPIVDASNSYDQFREHLLEHGILNLFSDTFLSGFSLYIDDMRMLKNICNEFTVYKERLTKQLATDTFSADKMMAMIAYKNLFPRDFGDLQLRRGFVFAVFYNKQLFVAEKIKSLNAEIQVIQDKISNTQNEYLTSSTEVDAIYANELNTAQHNRTRNLRNAHIELQEIEQKIANRKETIKNHIEGNVPILEA